MRDIKNKMSFLVIIGLVIIPLFCYSLDYKVIHEKADAISLEEALRQVEQKPTSIDNLYLLGLVYLNLYQKKEAKKSFEKILSIEPNLIEAKWGIAEVLRREHRLDKSENLLKEVLSQNPEFIPALITLAYIEYVKMDFKESLRLAAKVVRQRKDNVDLSNYVRGHLLLAGAKGMIAHYGGPLAKTLHGLGVLPTLNKAIKLQPDSAGVLFGLGSFYLLAPSMVGGDTEKAYEYLNKAVEADPFFVDAYVRLAQVYKVKGDSQKYQELLNKALEIDPQSELALDIKNEICNFICVKE